MRQRILVGGPAAQAVVASYRAPDPAALGTVKVAFLEMRRLRIGYADEAGRTTEREIEPQFLYLNPPVSYLPAWDHLRGDVGSFRIDRIGSTEKLNTGFRGRDPRPFLANAEEKARAL